MRRRLTLHGVDDDELLMLALVTHQAGLARGGEARAPAPAQARGFELVEERGAPWREGEGLLVLGEGQRAALGTL